MGSEDFRGDLLYFLGIRSRPGRFLCNVECDGVMVLAFDAFFHWMVYGDFIPVTCGFHDVGRYMARVT